MTLELCIDEAKAEEGLRSDKVEADCCGIDRDREPAALVKAGRLNDWLETEIALDVAIERVCCEDDPRELIDGKADINDIDGALNV